MCRLAHIYHATTVAISTASSLEQPAKPSLSVIFVRVKQFHLQNVHLAGSLNRSFMAKIAREIELEMKTVAGLDEIK